MKIFVLKSKIHQARVTEKNIEYNGSITIDRDLMDKADLREYEKVEIYDIENGERFSTYVIEGERGKGEIILNGAAARKVEKGDRLIIASYAIIDKEESFKPRIIILDESNKVKLEKKL